MPVLALIIIGAIIVASTRTAKGSPARRQLEQLATETALAWGIEPAVLLATVDVESAWDPNAQNHGPGDDARGGAWGLAQLTVTTALAVDDGVGAWADEAGRREPKRLLEPQLNLTLACALITENGTRSTAPMGSETWYQDLASLYNSGKPYAQAPSSTRTTYVPRFMRALERRKGGLHG